MQLIKALIGSSALIALAAASPAAAQSLTHTLKGDFAFSGTAVCVVSSATFTPTYTPPQGFTADLQPIGPSGVLTLSIQGVRTFNGDGTGTVFARVVSLGNPGPGSATELSAQFTYSVAADRTLTINQGPTLNTFVAGLGTGEQVSVSNIPTFTGRYSSDMNSLTFGSFDPGVETVTRITPAPALVESVRICHRARTGIRISRIPGSHGNGEDLGKD
jgi:hypothetical protein